MKHTYCLGLIIFSLICFGCTSTNHVIIQKELSDPGERLAGVRLVNDSTIIFPERQGFYNPRTNQYQSIVYQGYSVSADSVTHVIAAREEPDEGATILVVLGAILIALFALAFVIEVVAPLYGYD